MWPIKKSDIFFIVCARTKTGAKEKASELEKLGVPYAIICAEKFTYPKVFYREKKGKFDAINYAVTLVNKNTKIVCLNDVDNKIYNFNNALQKMVETKAGIVFCKIKVADGPQRNFYALMDRIRKIMPITSSGDLMLINKNVFHQILPIPACKTEDNYITFKAAELGYKVLFCDEAWIETKKTSTLKEESQYKTRTVTGLYQAISLTKTQPVIRIFYLVLPFVAPLLLLQGKRGIAWITGIIQGFTSFLRGDKEGTFDPIGN